MNQKDLDEIIKRNPALTIVDKKKVAKKKPKTRLYASKLEESYVDYLNALKVAGKILAWRYEPLSLRLADKEIGQVWYKPDFLVEYPDGTFTLDEVKGWMRTPDRIRLLVAASRYPWFRFRLVTRNRVKDPWVIENIGKVARDWVLEKGSIDD
jgi:hypothetical protein